MQTPHGQSTEMGRIPFPSTPAHGASSLAHSSSLPVPAPRSDTLSISNRSANSSVHLGTASPSPSAAGRRTATDSSALRTPPRRVYHVANGSAELYTDPPPAYVSPVRGGDVLTREGRITREPCLRRFIKYTTSASHPHR